MAIADIGLGAQLGLKDLLMRRFQQQQYADQLKQQQFENARQLAGDSRADQQIAETSSLRRAMEADAATQKGSAEANALGEQIPANTFLPESDPGVATMQKFGRGFLLTKQDARPAVTEGPLLPGDTGAAKPQGFIKTATQKQNSDAANLQNKQELTDIRQQLASVAQQRADQGPKDPTPHFALQPEVDPKTGQQTGRFLGYNTITNRFEPVAGGAPQATKAAPGAGQAAEKEKSKATARTTLDRLDTDIDTAAQKGLIGPAAGRISDIETMVGNNDPAISTLATRMVAAKMLVDAGIGGMRGAASPGLMARWDKLMGMQATPDNLHAVSQVMREMVGGEQKPAAGAAPAGDVIYARDPQGKLHQAKKGTPLPAGWSVGS